VKVFIWGWLIFARRELKMAKTASVFLSSLSFVDGKPLNVKKWGEGMVGGCGRDWSGIPDGKHFQWWWW
jgi:hypothetical protein